jgi:hypothetical protein
MGKNVREKGAKGTNRIRLKNYKVDWKGKRNKVEI